MDVDPFEITKLLRKGRNVIAVEAFYFGTGESMWVAGKPGLLLSLDLTHGSGRERVVSDASWSCYLDRAHRPGQYQRWLLRALQEEFDARLHPYGWDTVDYIAGREWAGAMVIKNASNLPSLCAQYEDPQWLRSMPPQGCFLRKRSIPLLREELTSPIRLQESAWVHWSRDPADWFEFRMPGCFRIDRTPVASAGPNEWHMPQTPPGMGMLATFEFKDELVGYPYFTIDAPEGTVIEVSCQEGHDPKATAWLDTHWFKWTRFTCREGVNRFEASDTEGFRWMQLHIHKTGRPITLRDVGARRRVFPWPNTPYIVCSEQPLQRLFDASLNTLCNSAQETSNDPGREREQYGGCGSLQLQAVRYGFGEWRMPRRALRTYSEGLSPEGYFLDPWPAYEVLSYLGQRQIGATVFGSQIDEGVTFTLNCWNHLHESGDLDSMREIYPRLLRLSRFLQGAIGPDGLLPTEHVGGATLNVWIDDDAYPWSGPARWRQCAFNLHVACVFKGALAPMAAIYGDSHEESRLKQLAAALEAATVRVFWSPTRGIFVDNQPWLDQEKSVRFSDRVLATSILYDQCPAGNISASARLLVQKPPEMALSYPMNSIWRYWALGRIGRGDLIVDEMRNVWATMPAVIENNALPEIWNHKPDRRDEYNYFQVTPLNVLFTEVAGIQPLTPGFARARIRPQLADLGSLDLISHTRHGGIRFTAEPSRTGHHVRVTLPSGCEAELVLPEHMPCRLPALGAGPYPGLRRYGLASGHEHQFETSPSHKPGPQS
jgi:hypothetical protein